MKKLLLLFFPLVVTTSLGAQNTCMHILRQGIEALRQGNTEQALRKLQDAETCDYQNQIRTQRQQLQNSIFAAVKKQREEALAAKAQAEKERERAEILRKEAEDARAEAERERQNAQAALDKANSLLLAAESRELLNTDPTIALLKAYEAIKLDPSPNSYKALIAAFYAPHYHYEKQSEVGVTSIAHSEEKRIVALGFANGHIDICDYEFKECRRLYGHIGKITALLFVENESMLISSAADRKLKLWDIQKGFIKTVENENLLITDLAMGATGNFYAATANGVVQQWKTNAYAVWGVVNQFTRQDMLEAKRITYSKKQDAIIVQSSTGTFLLKGGNSRQLGNIQKTPTALAVSPDGDRILIGTGSGEVFFYDFEGVLKDQLQYDAGVTEIAFSSDIDIIFGLKSGKLVSHDSKEQKDVFFLGHREAITGCAFIKKNNTLISISSDNFIKIWNSMYGGLVEEVSESSSDNQYFIPSLGTQLAFKEAKSKFESSKIESAMVLIDTLEVEQLIIQVGVRLTVLNVVGGNFLKVLDFKGTTIQEEPIEIEDENAPIALVSEIRLSVDKNLVLVTLQNQYGKNTYYAIKTIRYMRRYCEENILPKNTSF